MRLAIDTATRHAMVALGGADGVVAAVVREVVPGRGTPLLSLLEEVLAEAGATMDDVEAIGVGTGPGSFTGLRAGLATAKTLCWRRGLPLVGSPTDVTIRRAAALADPTLRLPVAVILPAGARDHYLSLVGEDPELMPPTADLVALTSGVPVAGVDLDAAAIPALTAELAARGFPDPLALGTAALARGPEALLGCIDDRLAAGLVEDPAALVPRYVALPRGIAAVPVESDTSITDTTRQGTAWSPTHP
jgi:tRNA threonylcarbamoyl adenosine modification protein YeaZ